MITVKTYAELPRRIGAQAFVILGLLQAARMMNQGPVTAQWLFDHSPSFGKNTITDALRKLTDPEIQLAIRVQGGWIFNNHGVFQLPLGCELVDEQKSASQIPSEREFENDQQAQIIDVVPENEPGNDSQIPSERENPARREFEQSLVKLRESTKINLKENLNYLDSRESENRILLENAYLLFGKPITWHKTFANKSQAEILGFLANAFDTKDKLLRPWGLVYNGLLGKLKNKQPDKQYRENPEAYFPENYLAACGLVEIQEPDVSPVEDIPAEEPGEEMPGKQESPIEHTWQSVLAFLQTDMPRGSFEKWVSDTRPASWNGATGEMVILARDSDACDWLDSRLQSTIKHQLCGILNQDVGLRFVARSEI